MNRCALTALTILFFAAPMTRANPPATAPAGQDDTPILDRVIPELRFDNIAIEDAIMSIQQSTRGNIVVRWEGLVSDGVQKTARVKMHLWDIPVREAIAVLIASASVGKTEIDFALEGSVVVVSSAHFDLASYAVKIYDVRDILDIAIARRLEVQKSAGTSTEPKSVEQIEKDAAKELIDLVTEVVHSRAWVNKEPAEKPGQIVERAGSNQDGIGTLHIWAGRLFVSQSPVVTKHVEDFLALIRQKAR